MAAVVAEFFQIIGMDITVPVTLAELIPYLLQVVVGVALVSGVFGLIGKVVEFILDFTRWR